MKGLKYLLLILIVSYLGIGQPLSAQPLQKHNNSISLQLGMFHYNEDINDFISQNNSFLNVGLTYRREMSRIFALNVTGRHYEWNVGENMDLKTRAIQAMWVIHPYTISSSWRANRILPYAGAGVGYESHRLTSPQSDTTYQKLYIPLEVGLLFNVSPRWSIGVFSEYKLASVSPIKNTLDSPKLRLDLVNTAGVSLAYSFGSNKKKQSVPIIRTNQSFVQKRVLEESIVDSTIVSSEKVKDSTALFLEEYEADSTLALPEESYKDSTILWNDSTLLENRMQLDSTDQSMLFIPIALDSTGTMEDVRALSKKTVFVSDTIRVPVVLDITVNTQNSIMDSNYMVANPAGIKYSDKGAVTSPESVTSDASNKQMKEQLGQIDKNISGLYAQNRRENNRIESELKNIKLMLGVLNAELLLLTVAKTKTPNKEKEESSNVPTPPTVNMDSLVYLIDSLNSQMVTDTINIDVVNVNDSLLEEINTLQSENRVLADKLARLSVVADSTQIPDAPKKVVHTINFAVNSTEVDVVQLMQLNSLLDLLKNRPDYTLLLSGFTDKSGNANYNMMLSKKRVQAVKQELIKMGVSDARMVEQYFGSQKATATHNENDRKVELKVLESF